MKLIIVILSVFILSSQIVFGDPRQKMMVFSYEKPYKYELKNGSYKVREIVESPISDQEVEVSFDDELLRFNKLENDTVEIWLPLIGNPGILKITNTEKNVVREQLFAPLLPVDWDYFKNGKVHVIVSSHQDIAWMNTPDSCRHERVHDIILPALDLIENEPDFKFEMEQSLNLMEVLEDSPENKQYLIDSYKSPNFEWGATFTQPYEGMESGEQLVRQSYFGRRWIKNTLPGMNAKVSYNVDVPGRSLQVPQLFKKSGIDYLLN